MSVAAAVAIAFAAAAVGALLVRRWWVVVLAALVFPVFFFGLHESWWGTGVGDGWLGVAVVLTAGATFGAAAGLGLAQRLTSR